MGHRSNPRALMLLLNPKNKNRRILTEAVNFLLVAIYGYFFRPEQNLSGQNIVLKGVLFQDAVKSFKKQQSHRQILKLCIDNFGIKMTANSSSFSSHAQTVVSWYPISLTGQFSDHY